MVFGECCVELWFEYFDVWKDVFVGELVVVGYVEFEFGYFEVFVDFCEFFFVFGFGLFELKIVLWKCVLVVGVVFFEFEGIEVGDDLVCIDLVGVIS